MTSNRWTLIVILTSALSASPSYAGDPGTAAATFLNLGIGPRAIAMGSAQVGLAGDVYSTYWNPAGLARLDAQEAGFVQTQYLEDINAQYAAYAYPHPTLGTFAGSFTYLNVGKFGGYDAAGNSIGDIGANDAAMGLSYARSLYLDRRLGAEISAGMTGKWIQERLDTVSARAYAADMGMLFTPGLLWGGFLEGWKAGLDIRNLGTSLQYDTDSFPLPRTVTAGLSYAGTFMGEDVTLALDGRQPNDGPRSVGAGVEVVTLQTFILRAGYNSQGDLGNGLRVGAGLKFKTIQVDYAFAAAGDLGNTQFIGLTVRFKAATPDPKFLAEKYYEKGMMLYKQRRFTEALVDFNKALEIDPAQPDAMRMMKQTYEQIKIITPE